MNIHESASKGYRAAAETYASGRPAYPSEAAAWLREIVGLGPGRTVLDLGAGTGKFTALLKTVGPNVIALEPVEAMRNLLARAQGDAEIVGGTADAIPLPDGAVDAVVCAQSFHWFATAAAMGEIRRVLVPNGMLGLIWNVRDESVGWVAALSAILSPYEAGTPRYRDGAWQSLVPAEGFAPVAERHAPNPHIGPPEQVIVQRTMSVSFVAALPPGERDRVECAVRALIDRTPDLAERAEVAFPYETRMFAYRKTG